MRVTPRISHKLMQIPQVSHRPMGHINNLDRVMKLELVLRIITNTRFDYHLHADHAQPATVSRPHSTHCAIHAPLSMQSHLSYLNASIISVTEEKYQVWVNEIYWPNCSLSSDRLTIADFAFDYVP